MKNLSGFLTFLVLSICLLFITSCEQTETADVNLPIEEAALIDETEISDEEKQNINLVYRDVIYNGTKYDYKDFSSSLMMRNNVLSTAKEGLVMLSDDNYRTIKQARRSLLHRMEILPPR